MCGVCGGRVESETSQPMCLPGDLVCGPNGESLTAAVIAGDGRRVRRRMHVQKNTPVTKAQAKKPAAGSAAYHKALDKYFVHSDAVHSRGPQMVAEGLARRR